MHTEKLGSIQILRAVAALAVVVSHTSPEVGWLDYYLKQPTTYPSFLVGAAGVDLFFVISGFVMVYSSGPYYGSATGAVRFMVRRIIRIVPLYYLATGALLLSWRDIGTSFQQEGVTDGTLIASLLFVPWPRPGGGMNPILGVGWSLNLEMLFYVIFACALVFGRRKAVLLTITTLLVVIYGFRYLPVPIPFRFYSNPDILNFAVGMVLAIAYRFGLRVPRAACWPLIIASAATIVITEQTNIYLWSRWICWGVPSGIILLSALSLGEPSDRRWWTRLTLVLGNASYSIYLFHGVLMNMVRYDFLDLVVPLGSWSWAYAALLIGMSIGGSIIIFVLVERPITDALRLFVRRREARMHIAPA